MRTEQIEIKDDLGDKLCKYCPLEKKGVYGIDEAYNAGFDEGYERAIKDSI